MLQVTVEISATYVTSQKQLDDEVEAYTAGTGATGEVVRFSRFKEHRHAFNVVGTLTDIVKVAERVASDAVEEDVALVQIMRTLQTAETAHRANAYLIQHPLSNGNPSSMFRVVNANEWAQFVNSQRTTLPVYGRFNEYAAAERLRVRLERGTNG